MVSLLLWRQRVLLRVRLRSRKNEVVLREQGLVAGRGQGRRRLLLLLLLLLLLVLKKVLLLLVALFWLGHRHSRL